MLALCLVLASGLSASAQTAMDFYAGRTIYSLVGLSADGGAAAHMRLVVHHSDFDVLIPSHSRIGKLSGGTRISMFLGTPG